jgi:UPF0271 protein
MKFIDLNCDLGEGYSGDGELMQIVSSANIACGGHAGDEATMAATIVLAHKNGVAIGAHPSYRDRENFGRISVDISHTEIMELVAEQIVKLKWIADRLDAAVSHVKPHGALYNQAADDPVIASAIVKAVYEADSSLTLFGLAGSILLDEGRNAGIRVVGETFADRRYTYNGRLAPRSMSGAVIDDPLIAAEQALKIALGQPITTIDGNDIIIDAETICIHGDGVNAVSTARTIRTYLEKNSIEVRSYAD